MYTGGSQPSVKKDWRIEGLVKKSSDQSERPIQGAGNQVDFQESRVGCTMESVGMTNLLKCCVVS